MNNRERRQYNLMLVKKAAAGKLTADDLKYDDGEMTFDICLDLNREGHCKAKETLSERDIQRLRSQGRYFDITLDLSK
jgi:hypothetical protein